MKIKTIKFFTFMFIIFMIYSFPAFGDDPKNITSLFKTEALSSYELPFLSAGLYLAQKIHAIFLKYYIIHIMLIIHIFKFGNYIIRENLSSGRVIQIILEIILLALLIVLILPNERGFPKGPFALFEFTNDMAKKMVTLIDPNFSPPSLINVGQAQHEIAQTLSNVQETYSKIKLNGKLASEAKVIIENYKLFLSQIWEPRMLTISKEKRINSIPVYGELQNLKFTGKKTVTYYNFGSIQTLLDAINDPNDYRYTGTTPEHKKILKKILQNLLPIEQKFKSIKDQKFKSINRLEGSIEVPNEYTYLEANVLLILALFWQKYIDYNIHDIILQIYTEANRNNMLSETQIKEIADYLSSQTKDKINQKLAMYMLADQLNRSSITKTIEQNPFLFGQPKGKNINSNRKLSERIYQFIAFGPKELFFLFMRIFNTILYALAKKFLPAIIGLSSGILVIAIYISFLGLLSGTNPGGIIGHIIKATFLLISLRFSMVLMYFFDLLMGDVISSKTVTQFLSGLAIDLSNIINDFSMESPFTTTTIYLLMYISAPIIMVAIISLKPFNISTAFQNDIIGKFGDVAVDVSNKVMEFTDATIRPHAISIEEKFKKRFFKKPTNKKDQTTKIK